MGRPPCCDKVGIKKGPWTPEEDIILVSYIQEHGPGNWRSVPTNTGLLRCSKSCRLRWTNYLRPGIKRGNFTAHEEGMIIHLQALLGNKWAAIASYLPQRTDNDIKNYWNTHLKKKLKKFQAALEPQVATADSTINCQFSPKSFNAQITPTAAAAAASLPDSRLNQTSSTYASSTENISRLLEGWMRASPKTNQEKLELLHQDKSLAAESATNQRSLQPKAEGATNDVISLEELDSILSIENLTNSIGSCWDKPLSNCDKSDLLLGERKPKLENGYGTFLEKWLLDEMGGSQEEEAMDLPLPTPMF